MSYWNEVMQDDAHMLAAEGWSATKTVRQLVPYKDKNGNNKYREEADFEFGKGKAKSKFRSNIIRPELVITKFFAEEKAALDAATEAREDAAAALEAFIEEQSGEDSLIDRAQGDNGKYAQAEVKRQIKEGGDPEEVTALKQLLSLQKAESSAKSTEKKRQEQLDSMTFDKIPNLTSLECKELTVSDKWLATLEGTISNEIERMAQALATRVAELIDRYATPLPDRENQVRALSVRVEDHLRKMGLTW